MEISSELTKELAFSVTPEGEKTLQAQLAAMLAEKSVEIYSEAREDLKKPQIGYTENGHVFRFWDFHRLGAGDPPVVDVILAAMSHLKSDDYRFLRVTEDHEVEQAGEHAAFQTHFGLTYVPLIAV